MSRRNMDGARAPTFTIEGGPLKIMACLPPPPIMVQAKGPGVRVHADGRRQNQPFPRLGLRCKPAPPPCERNPPGWPLSSGAGRLLSAHIRPMPPFPRLFAAKGHCGGRGPGAEGGQPSPKPSAGSPGVPVLRGLGAGLEGTQAERWPRATPNDIRAPPQPRPLSALCRPHTSRNGAVGRD